MINMDSRITLIKPGEQTQNPDGTITRLAGERFEVWARRRERAGREGIVSDVELATVSTEYVIRRRGFQDMTAKWKLQDRGVEYRIDAVYEPYYAWAPREYLIIIARLGE